MMTEIGELNKKWLEEQIRLSERETIKAKDDKRYSCAESQHSQFCAYCLVYIRVFGFKKYRAMRDRQRETK